MTSPRVSVLTAARNAAGFIAAAMESVLAQSYGDFEYVLVDDASDDATAAIIADFARRDTRVRLIRNSVRAGAAGALNRGLPELGGDYVAILDHDDLMLADRLERQLRFMDKHPDYGAVGSAVRNISTTGENLRQRSYPEHPAAAHWNLLFGTSLLHSASLYRSSLLHTLKGYSAGHSYLCDYELLIRIAEHAPIGNLPDELACYRLHAGQISTEHSLSQNSQMLLLQYALHWRWLGLRTPLGPFMALLRWTRANPPQTVAAASAAMNVLRSLFASYVEHFPLSTEEYQQVAKSCARRWVRLAHNGYAQHPALSRECWREARSLDPGLIGNLEFRRGLRTRSQRPLRQ